MVGKTEEAMERRAARLREQQEQAQMVAEDAARANERRQREETSWRDVARPAIEAAAADFIRQKAAGSVVLPNWVQSFDAHEIEYALIQSPGGNVGQIVFKMQEDGYVSAADDTSISDAHMIEVHDVTEAWAFDVFDDVIGAAIDRLD